MVKDYLGYENARNKKHAATYEKLLRIALLQEGAKVDVLIGHHICFEIDGDLTTENEIPSADCLMFDHDLMSRVFGGDAMQIMMHLAKNPVGERDFLLSVYLEQRQNSLVRSTLRGHNDKTDAA